MARLGGCRAPLLLLEFSQDIESTLARVVYQH